MSENNTIHKILWRPRRRNFPVPEVPEHLLLEDGQMILTENDEKILLENG